MALDEELDRRLRELARVVRLAPVERESSRWTLSLGGDQQLELELEGAVLTLRFAGWEERAAVDADELDDGEAEAELVDLALDFAAAASFGELRVVERRAGQAAARRLEVLVDGQTWRVHGRSGGLGLGGSVSSWLGRVPEVVVRVEGRPRGGCRALAKARPRGLPRAPWAGAAAGLDGDTREDAQALPLDGELDLHNFSPREVGPLVREYVAACRGAGVLDLRVVHGKGKGVLRRTVHVELGRLREAGEVESFRLGGHGEGSWGATIVRLEPP